MHWFTQHFAVALLRGYVRQESLSNAGGSRQGWHLWDTGGQWPQKLPPGTAPATSCSAPHNMQWQLLFLLIFHPCLFTHGNVTILLNPQQPPHTVGFFLPGICLDLRYMLIYYAESQTFSCSKKCHFTSPRVLPHYHFNKKQKQGFEARPPIHSTLLSLASQPTIVLVHSTRCLLDERKTKRWLPLMDHYAKHPKKHITAWAALISHCWSVPTTLYHVLAQKEL